MQLLDWLWLCVDRCGRAMCCNEEKDAKSMTIKLAEGLGCVGVRGLPVVFSFSIEIKKLVAKD